MVLVEGAHATWRRVPLEISEKEPNHNKERWTWNCTVDDSEILQRPPVLCEAPSESNRSPWCDIWKLVLKKIFPRLWRTKILLKDLSMFFLPYFCLVKHGRCLFNHMKPRFQNPPILPTSSGSTGQQLSVRKLNTLTCSKGFPWKSLNHRFKKNEGFLLDHEKPLRNTKNVFFVP